MSRDDQIARDLNARDTFNELRELRERIARLEQIMWLIALSLGIRPSAIPKKEAK